MPHVNALSERYDIDIIANFSEWDLTKQTNVNLISLPIERKISFVSDLRALLLLTRVFKRNQYSIVHSITPKAGLLAMFASRFASVPLRIHWFTGQVWVTRQGFRRKLLKYFDKLTSIMSNFQLVDSQSQLLFLVNEKVLTSSTATVLENGSICGVDPERFKPDPALRDEIRNLLEIPPDAIVVLFVGRINKDKGFLDLVMAIQGIPNSEQPIYLLAAGADEEGLIELITGQLHASGLHFIYAGITKTPEKFMAAADIFCLPSYREGFGLSVIEASSCALPCVVSNIYGLTDAVNENETGLIFIPGDIHMLSEQLTRLISNEDLRSQLGAAGRERVLLKFTQNSLTRALSSYYQALLTP